MAQQLRVVLYSYQFHLPGAGWNGQKGRPLLVATVLLVVFIADAIDGVVAPGTRKSQ